MTVPVEVVTNKPEVNGAIYLLKALLVVGLSWLISRGNLEQNLLFGKPEW